MGGALRRRLPEARTAEPLGICCRLPNSSQTLRSERAGLTRWTRSISLPRDSAGVIDVRLVQPIPRLVFAVFLCIGVFTQTGDQVNVWIEHGPEGGIRLVSDLLTPSN